MDDSLTTFIESMDSDIRLRVEEDLGDGYVVLRTDEAERRQAVQDIRCSEDLIIELLRNSRDAGATRIYVATALEQGKRRFTVIDNGCGIPSTMHARIFEPRVTSKLDTVHFDKWGIHGRGMALYSISCACEEAVVKKSSPSLGTSIQTISSLAQLREKSDQSTFPSFTLEHSSQVKISGPKNILRTCCEFALEHRGQLNVYVGSASDMIASMIQDAQEYYSLAELSLRPDLKTTPLVDLPAFEADPQRLATLCSSLGLDISGRTARRILDGDVEPVDSLSRRIKASVTSSTEVNRPHTASKRTANKRQLSSEDLSSLQDAVSNAFSPIATSYYYKSDIPVEARISGGRVHLSFPLLPQDDG